MKGRQPSPFASPRRGRSVVVYDDAHSLDLASIGLTEGAEVVVVINATSAEVVATWVAPATMEGLLNPSVWQLDDLDRSVRVDGSIVGLTPTEYRLLVALMGRAPAPVSLRELLRVAWDHDIGPTATVSVHMRQLRQKLESDPDHPRFLRTIRGRGYCFDPNQGRSITNELDNAQQTLELKIPRSGVTASRSCVRSSEI